MHRLNRPFCKPQSWPNFLNEAIDKAYDVGGVQLNPALVSTSTQESI
jgi:hypothetical protein